jgi:ring-1,2-phenylacetyl-CoA epoxidase subunit PaaC
MQPLIEYTLFLADTNLILAQKNMEWCGHAPVLEQDIAMSNIALDLIGQSRNFYQYAAQLLGNNHTEDSLAYLRNERDFKNLLLTEQPNGDWAQTIVKQFFYSVYQYMLYRQLQHSTHPQWAAIAAKSIKETAYHLKWSGDWVIRLGDGSTESNTRMNAAIEALWEYTGEMFIEAPYEAVANIDLLQLQQQWIQQVQQVFAEATLTLPENRFMQTGGKIGLHTEQMGYILAEMQHLHRAYPGAEW